MTQLQTRPAADIGPAPISVTVLRDLAALESARSSWELLERQAPATAFFQRHALTAIWARHYVDPRTRLLVLLLADEAGPCLLLPLSIETRLGLTIASIAGSPLSQYAEALAPAALEGERLFDTIVTTLRAEGIDELNLEGVRHHTLLHDFARHCRLVGLNRRVAPYVNLATFADHDTYVRNRSKTFGKKMRARLRQLCEDGEVAFGVIEGGPDARRAMVEAVELKCEWLAHRGAMSKAFLDRSSRECLPDLAENAPGAMVLTLRRKGAIVAVRLGFACRDTFFSYLSAYDESLAGFSPGKLLMDFTLAEMRRRGIDHVDLLPPASDNKTFWCDEAVAVADYVLPMSVRGHLHAGIYRHGLRPVLRSAYYALPAPLRRAMARALLPGTSGE